MVARHEAPGARLVGQVLASVNPAPTISIARSSSVIPPLLRIVTRRAALVVPAVWEPKAMLAGSTPMFGLGGSDPTPARAMVRGLPDALSVIEMDPVREPASNGVNVTLKLQAAPAPSDAPHVVEAEKSPDAAMIWEIARSAVPVLTIVTLCGAELVPIICAGNESAEGESETLGAGNASPSPLKATASGLDAALLAIVSRPERAPLALGWKVTDTVHDTPAARLDGQLGDCVKSPDTENAGAVNRRSAPPVLVIVTNCAPELVPSSRLPKAREAGERLARGTFEELTLSVALAPAMLETGVALTWPVIAPTAIATV